MEDLEPKVTIHTNHEKNKLQHVIWKNISKFFLYTIFISNTIILQFKNSSKTNSFLINRAGFWMKNKLYFWTNISNPNYDSWFYTPTHKRLHLSVVEEEEAKSSSTCEEAKLSPATGGGP